MSLCKATWHWLTTSVRWCKYVISLLDGVCPTSYQAHSYVKFCLTSFCHLRSLMWVTHDATNPQVRWGITSRQYTNTKSVSEEMFNVSISCITQVAIQTPTPYYGGPPLSFHFCHFIKTNIASKQCDESSIFHLNSLPPSRNIFTSKGPEIGIFICFTLWLYWFFQAVSTTYKASDMCDSPAKDYGWIDPGIIHTVTMDR